MEAQTYTTTTKRAFGAHVLPFLDALRSQSPEELAQVETCVRGFASLSLAELEGYALLRRSDTKYLLNFEHFRELFPALTTHYKILEIEGRRLHHYRTLYFDTPGFALYRQHHAGRRHRYKVRYRHYTDSNLAFVEVKEKVRAHRTVKHRQRVDRISDTLAVDGGASFVRSRSPYSAGALEPTLGNEFLRITLAGKDLPERLTVDLGLRLFSEEGGATLPGLVVMEVKQKRFSFDSPAICRLRTLGVRPLDFSKYCAGVNLLYPQVKGNGFKPRMLKMYKIMQGGVTC